MRTIEVNMPELRVLLIKALNHQSRRWFVHEQHVDFYCMKKVLEGKTILPAAAEKMKAAAELAVTLPPDKNLRKVPKLESNAVVDGVIGNPMYMLSKILEHYSSKEVKRRFKLFDNTMKAIREGRNIRTATMAKLEKAYHETIVSPLPARATPKKRPKRVLPPRAAKRAAKRRVVREVVRLPDFNMTPNPRPDLLRDIIAAARDPQTYEVLSKLAELHRKCNGKTEKALSLLTRMEEDGIPLSVFEVEASRET